MTLKNKEKKTGGTPLSPPIPNPHARGMPNPALSQCARHQAGLLPLQACPTRHRRPLPRREKTTTTEELQRCCRCCRGHCCRRRQRQSLLLLALKRLAPKRLDFRRRLLLPMTSQQRWQPRASRRRAQPVALPAYRGKGKRERRRRRDLQKRNRRLFDLESRTEKRETLSLSVSPLFPPLFSLKRCASVGS